MTAAASPRVLLFTGKGGVGKTTAAAATALRCADAGLRTIVLSTDPAHSLADAFDVPLTSVGSPITPMLWGQQLDAQERMEDSWTEIQRYLSRFVHGTADKSKFSSVLECHVGHQLDPVYRR